MGRAHEVRAASMAKTAAMKSKLYSRFGKEIYMAAKSGGTDPTGNLTLKSCIEKAKAAQVPSDVIKRNIDKAKGGGGENYESVTYEGFGPGSCKLIVECMTDNVNRTFGEVRSCFTKTGGKIGVGGSVLHSFEYVALLIFEGMTEDEALEAVMNGDAEINDISSDEDGVVTIKGKASDLDKIKNALVAAKADLNFFEEKMTYLPLNYIKLETDDLRKYNNFINYTNELDDVQEVFSDVDLPETEEE